MNVVMWASQLAPQRWLLSWTGVEALPACQWARFPVKQLSARGLLSHTHWLPSAPWMGCSSAFCLCVCMYARVEVAGSEKEARTLRKHWLYLTQSTCLFRSLLLWGAERSLRKRSIFRNGEGISIRVVHLDARMCVRIYNSVGENDARWWVYFEDIHNHTSLGETHSHKQIWILSCCACSRAWQSCWT